MCKQLHRFEKVRVCQNDPDDVISVSAFGVSVHIQHHFAKQRFVLEVQQISSMCSFLHETFDIRY